MRDFLERAQKYQTRIREILLNDWDPIGINEEPDAQDEYDSYIHEIHLLLIRHERVDRLIDHLWWIENSHMGLFGNRTRTERVAHRLIELREQLEAGA